MSPDLEGGLMTTWKKNDCVKKLVQTVACKEKCGVVVVYTARNWYETHKSSMKRFKMQIQHYVINVCSNNSSDNDNGDTSI